MDYTLSDEQRKLVENNLSVIDQVIRKRITMNREIPGMEYDDLYQIGAIGLCKAAVKYQKKENAAFETYAFRVIKNELLDHARSVLRKEAARSRFISDEEAYLRQVQGRNNEFTLNERTSIDILLEKRNDVSETTRKGINAMVLQMQGYSGTDIAEKYDVKPNYVTACISRARKHLLNDRKFVNAMR